MLKTRIARPTSDLGKILKFYHEGLGLEVLGEFRDPEGFDGVILGKKQENYRFEFTVEKGVSAPRSPSKDNLIIFYHATEKMWLSAIERMSRAGFPWVKSHNPYWDRGGRTFEDVDGYRVVLFQGEWKN